MVDPLKFLTRMTAERSAAAGYPARHADGRMNWAASRGLVLAAAWMVVAAEPGTVAEWVVEEEARRADEDREKVVMNEPTAAADPPVRPSPVNALVAKMVWGTIAPTGGKLVGVTYTVGQAQ